MASSRSARLRGARPAAALLLASVAALGLGRSHDERPPAPAQGVRAVPTGAAASEQRLAFVLRVSRVCRGERRRLAALRPELRLARRLGRAGSRAQRASRDGVTARRALSRLVRAARRGSRRLAKIDPPAGPQRHGALAYLEARRAVDSTLELYRDAVLVGEVDAYPTLERERSRLTSRARRIAARSGLDACAAV